MRSDKFNNNNNNNNNRAILTLKALGRFETSTTLYGSPQHRIWQQYSRSYVLLGSKTAERVVSIWLVFCDQPSRFSPNQLISYRLFVAQCCHLSSCRTASAHVFKLSVH